MRHLSITEVRTQLPNLLESTERIVITRNGQPMAVVLGIDDFRALQAVQALARNPGALRDVLTAHTRVLGRGDLEGLEDFVPAAEKPAVARRGGDR